MHKESDAPWSLRLRAAAIALALFAAGWMNPAARGQMPVRAIDPPAEAAPYESDILSARPVRYLVGIAPVVMPFQHLGDFSPSCDCLFSGGRDVKAAFALEFSIRYPKLGFAIKNMVAYQNLSAEFSRRSTRKSVVVGDNPDIDVAYENSSAVNLRYLAVSSSFAWYIPYTQLFLSAGLEVGFPLKKTYDHIERILTPGVSYYNGATVTTLLPEEEIPGADRLRIGIALGAGADIPLSTVFTITPQFGATYPLTTVTSADKDWRVLTEYGMLFFKVRL